MNKKTKANNINQRLGLTKGNAFFKYCQLVSSFSSFTPLSLRSNPSLVALLLRLHICGKIYNKRETRNGKEKEKEKKNQYFYAGICMEG